jgi:hypothetical protein
MSFSKEIENILEVGAEGSDENLQLTYLGRPSGSLLSVGDVLLFHYNLAGLEIEEGKETSLVVDRIGLIVKPVFRQAGTGNELLTVVKIDSGISIDPDTLSNLYNNRGILGADMYRTYIVSKVLNSYRFHPLEEESE